MVVFLTLCLAVLEACLPCSGTMSGGTRDVGTLAKMVKGRALLLCVKKGMTEEQVEGFLGKPDREILSGGGISPGLEWLRSLWYFRSGLLIRFEDEKVSSFSYLRHRTVGEPQLQQVDSFRQD